MDGNVQITAKIDSKVYERMTDLIVPILAANSANSYDIKVPKELYMV